MSTFRPVGKQNTADLVYDQLLERISSGEWVEGDRIPSENELRESLSVSRDSVREAIKRLAAMGLLRSEQGKGTFVQKIDTGFYLNMLAPAAFLSEDDGIGILQFMKAIQVESARIAADLRTEEDLQQLEACLEKMATEHSSERFFRYDNRFHAILCRITGNELFIRAAEMASGTLHVCLRAIVEIHGSEASIREHRQILECVRVGDGKGAARVMVEHYDTIMARLSQYLQESKAESAS